MTIHWISNVVTHMRAVLGVFKPVVLAALDRPLLTQTYRRLRSTVPPELPFEKVYCRATNRKSANKIDSRRPCAFLSILRRRMGHAQMGQLV